LYFFLYHGIQAITNILFALNEVYDPADRREERTVLPHLTCVPQEFMSRLTSVLQGPFDEHGAIESAGVFKELADETLRMAEAELADDTTDTAKVGIVNALMRRALSWRRTAD
jgi:hypothetical protein